MPQSKQPSLAETNRYAQIKILSDSRYIFIEVPPVLGSNGIVLWFLPLGFLRESARVTRANYWKRESRTLPKFFAYADIRKAFLCSREKVLRNENFSFPLQYRNL